MTLNGVMAVTLRYFTELGKHTFQHNRRLELWRNLCTSLLYFVARVRCRRKEVHVRYLISWWVSCLIPWGFHKSFSSNWHAERWTLIRSWAEPSGASIKW